MNKELKCSICNKKYATEYAKQRHEVWCRERNKMKDIKILK